MGGRDVCWRGEGTTDDVVDAVEKRTLKCWYGGTKGQIARACGFACNSGKKQ